MLSLPRRVTAAGLCALAVCGCGSTVGTKPSANIRVVEAATNTVDINSHTDAGFLLVNTAAASAAVPYATPTEYLYVEAGTSSFSGGFPNGLPTISADGVSTTNTKTLTLPTYLNTTVTPNVTAVVPSPVTSVNLLDGHHYTAFLCGRPDVASPSLPDRSDLDPRYFSAVVLEDNQPAPPAGSATVRVVLTAADSGNVNVLVNGAAISAFQNVVYAPKASQPSTANATIPAGTVTITVKTASGGAVLVPATPVTLTSGSAYTLVVDEPVAAPTPAVKGAAPTYARYAISLIKN